MTPFSVVSVRHALPPCALLFSGHSPTWLQHFVQLFERLGVFGADRVIATGIRSLQRPNHRGRDREWSATMVGLTHKVPLRSSRTVTFKAVSAKLIDDVGRSSVVNSRSIFDTSRKKNSQSCVVASKPLLRLTMTSVGD